MRYHLFKSLIITTCMITLCCFGYVLIVRLSAVFFPGGGLGVMIRDAQQQIVGYVQIGQPFTSDRYFWGRPSAIDYDASQSGGSNLAPSNPLLIQQVQERIKYFETRNPGIAVSRIPVDLVTTSGSGLDPDISPEAAFIQVKRVAQARQLPEQVVDSLVRAYIQPPLLHLLGPAYVNVLQLNLALDKLSSSL
ncbi:potassium-transporting ATPase subunit KdpC [Thermoflavifilum thermophilum]|uniref:Potassium-transporting ATPase KdpC subunit n=1 Tax=Thermoflavifilum thermophilum TaxID=1393122 RepID=A0A1I7NMF1_9BACT|nr:potassium-transporting ATPase subunit KdpC [Thermoflavifilum thermophilum]SFV35760.1 K+-transporting ATPase ATPase C chain [Thermoflavifilum thermophilum]